MLAFFAGKIQLCSSWPEAVIHSMVPCPLSASAFSAIFWNSPFQDGDAQAADIKQGAAPPSGGKQQAPHTSLAEMRWKPSMEVFEQRMHTPVPGGDHIPSRPVFSCSNSK